MKFQDQTFITMVKLERKLLAAEAKIVQQQRLIDALNLILQVQIEEMATLEPLRDLLPRESEYSYDG
jgi:hypothetical protein